MNREAKKGKKKSIAMYLDLLNCEKISGKKLFYLSSVLLTMETCFSEIFHERNCLLATHDHKNL